MEWHKINNYRPLLNSLTIRTSEIDGLGLFATESIPKDTNLGIAHILIPHAEEVFPQSYCRTPLGGFYNHSTTPNCYLKSRLIYFISSATHQRLVTSVLELYTKDEIEKETELTCRYILYKMDD